MIRPAPWLSIATLVALLAGPGAFAPWSRIARGAAREGQSPAGAESITETQLRSYLAFIASDALEGRLTPSRGLDIAAAFLASHLARLGLRPAGDAGTYLQAIGLTRRPLDVEKTQLAVGTRVLVYGDDFVPGLITGSAEASVVYIGNGTVVRSRGLDPYKDIDVTGKIVVSNVGLPAGLAQADLAGPRGKDWEPTEDAAKARGAVAVLFLPDFAVLERWTANRDSRRTRAPLTVDRFREPGGGPVLPTATLSAHGIAALFAGERLRPDEAFQRATRHDAAPPFALSPRTIVRLDIVAAEEHLSTSNVVAVLEGGDPVLKHEYVAVGAHYDHLGTAKTPNAEGDTIFNGADDDGSGTVGLLALAEAFATTRVRPKRSLLFVWHTGEEQGLWGSRYFTDHPTVPIDRIVAQLNIDMIGRSRAAGPPGGTGSLALTDADSLYVVGSKRLSTELGAIVADVNARYHRLNLDYSLDATGDPGQIYERSDHYPYAKRGIPIAFFFTGVHADYHGLDDEIDRIDFTKMRRITQTIYAAARAIADAPRRPSVDAVTK